MFRINTYNLKQILTRSGYFDGKTFFASEFASETLLQISRVPHRYGLAYTAVGFAPHLLDFEGVEGFDGLMRADGFDLMQASTAMSRTVFELLERVWCFNAPQTGVTRANWRNLGDVAINPRDCALLSAFEYERQEDGIFAEYSDTLELDWVECFSLVSELDKKTRLVPAALAYQGYGHRYPAQRFVPTLSTGLAAATRYDDAVLRGLCEVIERDAFTIRWLGRLAPPIIENTRDLFTDIVAEVVEQLEADGLTSRFYDLTLDIPVPVVLMAIEGQSADGTPLVVLGLGCDPLAQEALTKAVREALEMMSNLYDFPGGTEIQHNGRVPKGSPEQKQELGNFLDGNGKFSKLEPSLMTDDSRQNMPAKLIELLNRIESAGFSAYYCDLTPHFEDEKLDFVLIRAIIPHMQPMLYEANCWRLKNPRLFRLIEEFAPNHATISEVDLNLQINPFAAEAIL